MPAMGELERPTQSRVWRWRRAIGESDLPATTRDILRVLSEFMDREGGSCFPTRADLAQKSGRDPKTISRALRRAERDGWLKIQGGIFSGQRWRNQSYLASFPEGEKVREFRSEAGGAMPDKLGEPCPQDNTSPSTSPNTAPENAGARALSRTERQRINREFLGWLPTWPKYNYYSDATARREWFLLSDDERRNCIRLTPVYLRQISGKARSSPADFLRERAWEGLPSSALSVQPERIEAKSFSPLWMATRFWFLLQPPTGQVAFTKFDNDRIEAGLKTRDELMREKLAVNGWPAVNAMMAAMRSSQPFLCPAALDSFTAEFRSVKKGSDLFAAWGRLHARRGWPFFTFAPNYVPFPAVDLGTADLDAAVEAAMTEIARLLSKVE
ncbi:Hypothetical protein NGAL_HAMBI1146_60040 [Neorhizobium galegae bv. officinalis]|nr:Hypothetical protein NGAL_HAMBI1146_60040 [Neorhizobium galegae bv. officinalis]